MYNPARFKSDNIDEAFELMFQNPFACLISMPVAGKANVDPAHTSQPQSRPTPLISHVPITPKKSGDQIELIGHLARANPHSQNLTHAVAIFQGPHAYITPSWYEEHDVPTWNYLTIHASGPIELIEDPAGIEACLRDLTAHAEKLWPSGWDFFVPDDLAGDILPRRIVGFRLKVSDLQFKKKLNQPRSMADHHGVLRGLESRTDDNSRGVLEAMRALRKD